MNKIYLTAIHYYDTMLRKRLHARGFHGCL